jgi:Fe-S-cluster formation regulator IscX/YfhJ
MYVYIYISIYMYICSNSEFDEDVSALFESRKGVFICMYIHMHVSLNKITCKHVCMYIYISIYMYICSNSEFDDDVSALFESRKGVFICMYIHMHVSLNKITCKHVCMCIYISIYMYICSNSEFDDDMSALFESRKGNVHLRLYINVNKFLDYIYTDIYKYIYIYICYIYMYIDIFSN